MPIQSKYSGTRTTLTLDDSVVAKIKSEMRRSGRSFKQVVNEYLRVGLNARKQAKTMEPFKITGKPMGLKPGLSLDNIGELLDQIEGFQHK